jgi:hypothetical protein
MIASKMISVIVAICFVFFIGLGRAAISENASR